MNTTIIWILLIVLSVGGLIAGVALSRPAGGAGAFDFDRDVIAASRERPVLVQLSATWCGPCQQLTPVVQDIAAEQPPRLTVVHIDVDAQRDLAGRLGVTGVPDVRLYVGGQPVDARTGYDGDAQGFHAWLDDALARFATPRSSAPAP